jgi:uncharacterized membrane protein
MHRVAAEKITQGLSLFPRIILAVVSGLFGVVMILVAPPTEKAFYFYSFGLLCILICVACLTTGRLRQFVGSIIGVALFATSLWYLYSQAVGGRIISQGRNEPSLLNSLLFFGAFGLPGIGYAAKVRFGMRRRDV